MDTTDDTEPCPPPSWPGTRRICAGCRDLDGEHTFDATCTLTECPGCGEPNEGHDICPFCGRHLP